MKIPHEGISVIVTVDGNSNDRRALAEQKQKEVF